MYSTSEYACSLVPWPASLVVDGLPAPPQPNDDIETTIRGYDDATGLLKSKTDDSGKSVVYTYTLNGRLQTRKWARDASVVTAYSNDEDTGEMTGVDHPGTDTPDVRR